MQSNIEVLSKKASDWMPVPPPATIAGGKAWARTVTIVEGFIGEEPPEGVLLDFSNTSDWQNEYAKMMRQRDELRVALDEIQTRTEVFIGDWIAVDSAYQPEDIQHLQQLYDIAVEALSGVKSS